MAESSPQLPEHVMSSRESLDRLADLNAKRIAHLTACLDSSNRELARLRAALATNPAAQGTNVSTVPSPDASRQQRTTRKPRTATQPITQSPVQEQAPPCDSSPKPVSATTASRAWTAEEQARFAAASATYGPRAWPEITAAVATRTQKQVRAYAQRLARRTASTPAKHGAQITNAHSGTVANRTEDSTAPQGRGLHVAMHVPDHSPSPVQGSGPAFMPGMTLAASPTSLSALRPVDPPSPASSHSPPRTPVASATPTVPPLGPFAMSAPSSPEMSKKIGLPMSPVTPSLVVGLSHLDRPISKKHKVGFKGLGPFAPDALAAARSCQEGTQEDHDTPTPFHDDVMTQSSCSQPDLVRGTSSMSCSSLSSCGRTDCWEDGDRVEASKDYSSSEPVFPEVPCPIVMEETLLGTVLSIDMGCDMDWSSLVQAEPLNVSGTCIDGVDEMFASDILLEDI